VLTSGSRPQDDEERDPMNYQRPRVEERQNISAQLIQGAATSGGRTPFTNPVWRHSKDAK
jgi:hypothetical protein